MEEIDLKEEKEKSRLKKKAIMLFGVIILLIAILASLAFMSYEDRYDYLLCIFSFRFF